MVFSCIGVRICLAGVGIVPNFQQEVVIELTKIYLCFLLVEANVRTLDGTETWLLASEMPEMFITFSAFAPCEQTMTWWPDMTWLSVVLCGSFRLCPTDSIHSEVKMFWAVHQKFGRLCYAFFLWRGLLVECTHKVKYFVSARLLSQIFDCHCINGIGEFWDL